MPLPEARRLCGDAQRRFEPPKRQSVRPRQAHLFRVAAEEGLEQRVKDGLSRMMVASIGPTTSEALDDYGVRVDFEPSHPKMGVFVQEAAAAFGERQRALR